MGLSNKVKINSIYVYMGEVLSKAILFIFNAILARKLGVANYGVYTFAYSIGLVLINIVDFGTNSFILKKISEDTEKNYKVVSITIHLELILSIIAFIALAVFLQVINYDSKLESIIIILFISLMFENLTNIYRNIYKALEKFGVDSAINVASSMSRIILGLFFYNFTGDIYGLSLGITISTIIVFMISIYVERRMTATFRYDDNPKNEGLVFVFKSCLVFALPIIIKALYLRIDSIMIKQLVSNIDLGLYNGVSKLIFTQYFLPLGIVQVIFPSLNKLFYEKNYISINEMFPKIFTIISVFFNLGSMMQVILAKLIIEVIYGKDYIASTGIYKMFALSFTSTSIIVLMSFLFLASDNIYLTNKYYAASSVIKVVSLIVLTKYFGILGAAISFLLSEVCLMIMFLYGAFRRIVKLKKIYITILLLICILDICLTVFQIHMIISLGILFVSSIFFLKSTKISKFYMKGNKNV